MINPSRKTPNNPIIKYQVQSTPFFLSLPTILQYYYIQCSFLSYSNSFLSYGNNVSIRTDQKGSRCDLDVIYEDVIYEDVIYEDVIYEDVIYEDDLRRCPSCETLK